MKKMLNKITTRIRGESFEIDKKVPAGYIWGVLITRITMLLRGYCRFRRINKMSFIGPRVRLKSKRSIRFEQGFSINEGCYLDGLSAHGLIFGKNVSIGARTIIEGTGSLKQLGKGLMAGDNVGIGPYSHIGCAGGVEIGSDTIMGNFVTIHSENHSFKDPLIPIRLQGVDHVGIKIGRNCWIGAKSMILDGAVIGDGCIIAGGSVVLKGNYPADSIIGGNPAKILKSRVNADEF